MKSKKRRELFQDCQAVSEVIGQMLMIGIVIIAVSTIALSVFSEFGTMKPAPSTYIQEKIDTKTHCVYITHNEGEDINLSAIKIILMFPNGHRDEFDNSNFDRPASAGLDDNVFAIGDCIVINDVNIMSGIDVEMFYVYTPSQLVIRHIVLHAPTNTTSLTDTTPSTDTIPSTDTTPSTEVNQKPIANFTSNVTEGYVPLDVQFTDHSENATGWSWDFGDGATSDQQSPAHTYSTAGTYTVNLKAINVNGTDSKLSVINILKLTPEVTWNNPANIVYGTPLSSTQLNALASVPGTYVYTPLAGTILNVGTQPLHVDFKPTDTTKYSTASADVQINVTAPQVPIADFSATPTYGTVPLNVAFTDASVGTPTSWKWDFGDGKSSTQQNPSYVYQSGGTYTISLTVANKDGTDTKTKTNYINVKNPSLAANFTATPTSGNNPLTVSFTDTSTGTPTSWSWDFGDKPNSTDKNPTHKYTKAGKYTVSLTVQDGFGTNTTTKTNYIIVS